MKIILDRYDIDTGAKIALGPSCEDNLKVGELIRFLMRVHKVCDNTEDTDVFFGSRITRITKHHFQPATIVEQLLAAHPNDDAIWDNTDPCNVSLDNSSGTEDLANMDVTKESVATTITPISTKDNEIWYNTIAKYDSWHEVVKTMNTYQEWDDPSIILEDTGKNNKSPKEYIKPDFYISKHQT